jgi:hypothetical protein
MKPDEQGYIDIFLKPIGLCFLDSIMKPSGLCVLLHYKRHPKNIDQRFVHGID